jgi:hypothetical protein
MAFRLAFCTFAYIAMSAIAPTMISIRMSPLRGAREGSDFSSGVATAHRPSRARRAQAAHSNDNAAIASITRWLRR